MLHVSEAWPVKIYNELALSRAKMRMFKQMCSVKLTASLPTRDMSDAGTEDIVAVLQLSRLQNLQWYSHMLRK